jgi:nitroreductase
MKFDELAKARRTIHQYEPEKIPDALVEKALELALWAPNHKLTFPWRFISLGPESRLKIAELGAKLKAKKKPLSLIEETALRKTHLNPSHLIVLAMKRPPEAAQAKEDYASVAMGVQNASLYLWENGIGSKWSSGALTTHERTYEIAGCDPKAEEIVGFLWIGRPERAPRPAARPPLNEVLRHRP